MSGVGDRLEFRGQYFRVKHGAVTGRRYRRRASDFPGFAFMIPQLAITGTDGRAGCDFTSSSLGRINERAFVKAEIVLPLVRLIVDSRACISIDALDFAFPLSPLAGRTFFPARGRTLEMFLGESVD
jgi:hypothetical protein